MARRTSYPGWGMLLSFAISLCLALYFTFAAVQGDYGLFRRAEILGDNAKLIVELDALESDKADVGPISRS